MTRYMELSPEEARKLGQQLIEAAIEVEAHDQKCGAMIGNGLGAHKYVRPETSVTTDGCAFAIRVGK